MQKIELITLRLAFLLLFFLNKIQLWAQDDDDDFLGGATKGDNSSMMDGMMDYQPVHFNFSDVIIVVFLLVACYVFGKIWKGCSYLLLAFAALMYYLVRF